MSTDHPSESTQFCIGTDAKGEVIYNAFRGRVTLSLLLEAYSRAGRDRLEPGMRVLTDLSQADLEISFEEMKAYAQRAAQLFEASGGPPSRTAMVAPRDVVFGLSRMYEMLSEFSHIHIFRDRAEAMAWLEVTPDQLAEAETNVVALQQHSDSERL